jgi:hypothetical protein
MRTNPLTVISVVVTDPWDAPPDVVHEALEMAPVAVIEFTPSVAVLSDEAESNPKHVKLPVLTVVITLDVAVSDAV